MTAGVLCYLRAALQKPWDRENSHTTLYVQQLQQLASKNSAAYLDIFNAWQADPDWHNKLLLPDKLHLSAQGNDLLFNQIVQALEKQIPDLAPSNIALNWPLMDVISKDDPRAAFSKVIQNPSTTARAACASSTNSGGSGKKFLQGQESSTIGTAHQAAAGATSASVRLSSFGMSWVLMLGVMVTVWLMAA